MAGPVREQPHWVLGRKTAYNVGRPARSAVRPVHGHPRASGFRSSPRNDNLERVAKFADVGSVRERPTGCSVEKQPATWGDLRAQRGGTPFTATREPADFAARRRKP